MERLGSQFYSATHLPNYKLRFLIFSVIPNANSGLQIIMSTADRKQYSTKSVQVAVVVPNTFV